MKKTLLLLLIVCSLGLSGCKKDSQLNDHNYYIKYCASWPNGCHLDALITDTDGSLVKWQSDSNKIYTLMIGPVKPGFEASIKLDGYYSALEVNTCTLEIYACRDAEPWVLKASGILEVSYTLDF